MAYTYDPTRNNVYGDDSGGIAGGFKYGDNVLDIMKRYGASGYYGTHSPSFLSAAGGVGGGALGAASEIAGIGSLAFPGAGMVLSTAMNIANQISGQLDGSLDRDGMGIHGPIAAKDWQKYSDMTDQYNTAKAADESAHGANNTGNGASDNGQLALSRAYDGSAFIGGGETNRNTDFSNLGAWRGGGVGMASGGIAAETGIHHPYTRGVGTNGGVPKGLVESSTPGRADAVHSMVPAGTYVIPADVVSTIGQGNSAAGAKKLDGLHGQAPRHTGYAAGGMVPVRLSGGEFRVHPDVVAGIGRGSLEEGRKYLDQLVHGVRQHAIKTMKNLPGPK